MKLTQRSVYLKKLASQLPEAYKKFWREWKQARPIEVNYLPPNAVIENSNFALKVQLYKDNPNFSRQVTMVRHAQHQQRHRESLLQQLYQQRQDMRLYEQAVLRSREYQRMNNEGDCGLERESKMKSKSTVTLSDRSMKQNDQLEFKNDYENLPSLRLRAKLKPREHYEDEFLSVEPIEPKRRCKLRSEVLNQYINFVISDKLAVKINDCFGLDHYLLKHPACTLRTPLAVKLKRKILQELLNGCPQYAHNKAEQQRLLKEYRKYLKAYTREEIEWYGYTYVEALKKLQSQLRRAGKLRQELMENHEERVMLLEQLRQLGIIFEIKQSLEQSLKRLNTIPTCMPIKNVAEPSTNVFSRASDWFAMINPFSKKRSS